MASQATIVTMFFDISGFTDSTSEVRPRTFYLEKCISTLSIDSPMVIFCDESSHGDIIRLRNQLLPGANAITSYVVKPIQEYDIYQLHFEIIRKNRQNDQFYVNNRNTVSYFILSMFKIVALLIAKQMNPFKSPFYAWLDFGGGHVMRQVDTYAPLMLANPHPKIAFCYIHYRSPAEMNKESRFCNALCGVAAGAFTVQREYVDLLYNGVMSSFHELLSYGIGHAEEQMLTLFYQKNPQDCTLFYGDYYSIIQNYHLVLDDYECIKRNFIDEAMRKNRLDIAALAASKVLESVREGTVTVMPDEIDWLSRIAHSVSRQ